MRPTGCPASLPPERGYYLPARPRRPPRPLARTARPRQLDELAFGASCEQPSALLTVRSDHGMRVMHHLEIKSLLQSDTGGMRPSFKRAAAVAKMTRCDYEKVTQSRGSQYDVLVTLDGMVRERIATVDNGEPWSGSSSPRARFGGSRVLAEAGITPLIASSGASTAPRVRSSRHVLAAPPKRPRRRHGSRSGPSNDPDPQATREIPPATLPALVSAFSCADDLTDLCCADPLKS
jgi:hypothetical protein